MNHSLLDGIFTRHSVRHFTSEPIPDKDLERIVKAGMAAPSAVNLQPWSFIVVTKRSVLNILAQKLPYARMLEKAAAAIIVCGKPDKVSPLSLVTKAIANVSARDYWVQDCCAASQNILLAAHAMGYGAVWTAVFPGKERIKAVRETLNIQEKLIPLNVIPVGVPVGDEKPKDKFKKENIRWIK
ncbi:MAG: nitroreductase family protein [Patescibacteria group bacterium]|jgi:nitroreductase